MVVDRDRVERAKSRLPHHGTAERNGRVRVVIASNPTPNLTQKLNRLLTLEDIRHIDAVTTKRGGFSRYMRHAR